MPQNVPLWYDCRNSERCEYMREVLWYESEGVSEKHWKALYRMWIMLERCYMVLFTSGFDLITSGQL